MQTISQNLYAELNKQVLESLEPYLLEEMNRYPAGAKPSISNTDDGLIRAKIREELEAHKPKH